MILGMPNVGKSSLINALRRIYMNKGRHCHPVGACAGAIVEMVKSIYGLSSLWQCEGGGYVTCM